MVYFSCNWIFFPDLSQRSRIILQYAPVDSLMDRARLSISSAISSLILRPIVLVFLPTGWVGMFHLLNTCRTIGIFIKYVKFYLSVILAGSRSHRTALTRSYDGFLVYNPLTGSRVFLEPWRSKTTMERCGWGFRNSPFMAWFRRMGCGMFLPLLKTGRSPWVLIIRY